ncbi:serine/threonine-protein kinase PCRK1-like [Capsicum chacoense]
MKCFQFSNSDKNDDQNKTTKSTSGQSSSASVSSTDRELKGSEYSSQHVLSDISTESSSRLSFSCLSNRKPCNLRVFTVEELKTATRNFSRSLMVGEGGFGGVYRGVLKDAKDSNIAVKQLSQRGLQGHKEWVTEVSVLGVVEHPNLVKLMGYCAQDDERGIQRLLVYEFLPNKSVQDHLMSRFMSPLPWEIRLSIARDAARGLAYLHEGMEFQIIFRDFKSSNILLDEKWNAKLSDFGLARLGPSDGLSHVSTAVVGTVGYAAPEYIQTGRLTAKSDVWSYGVFLYELITGRRPLDRNKPKNEQKLLEWVRPHLTEMKKFEQILDPRLDGNYSIKSAQKLAAIANRCLVKHPRNRPKMSEVYEMVNQIVEATAEAKSHPGTPVEESSTRSVEDEKFRVRCLSASRRLVEHSTSGENKLLVWKLWKPKLVSSN